VITAGNKRYYPRETDEKYLTTKYIKPQPRQTNRRHFPSTTIINTAAIDNN